MIESPQDHALDMARKPRKPSGPSDVAHRKGSIYFKIVYVQNGTRAHDPCCYKGNWCDYDCRLDAEKQIGPAANYRP